MKTDKDTIQTSEVMNAVNHSLFRIVFSSVFIVRRFPVFCV